MKIPRQFGKGVVVYPGKLVNVRMAVSRFSFKDGARWWLGDGFTGGRAG